VSRTRILLAAIAGSFVLAGAVEPHLPDAPQYPNALTVVHGLVTAILLFAWCKEDAKSRGITPPAASAALVALVAPIGVPYYFIRSMPGRTAAVAILKAAIFLIAVTLLGEAAYDVSAWITT
jgi:apolipoprotein N-acyltransferase